MCAGRETIVPRNYETIVPQILDGTHQIRFFETERKKKSYL